MASRPTVFVDGQSGTIGLRLRDLLAQRNDLELLEIAQERRRDPRARAELLDSADVSILCLPDDAAREAVALITNEKARVIDGSTAHRVAPGWVYGLPEIAADQRAAIAAAKRVANPGCWPTGAALLIRPLIDANLLAADCVLSIHGISGYSGGGKNMIERWEDRALALQSLPYPAPYALDRRHKHIPEMTRYARLAHEPYFAPSVGAFRCGMRVQVPLHASLIKHTDGAAIYAALRARYGDERFISVHLRSEPLGGDERALDPTACNDTNRVELHVLPHADGHLTLVALLDNLGKGAAGAAVQSLNLMLGLPEHTGLLTNRS